MKLTITFLALTLGTSAFAKSLACKGTDTINTNNWVTFLDVKLPIQNDENGEYSDSKLVDYKNHRVNVAYFKGAIIVQAWGPNGTSFLNVGQRFSSSSFRTSEALLEINCRIID